jgi:hypothetical protein
VDGPVPEIPDPEADKLGIDPKKLPGIVIDNRKADQSGKWGAGTGLAGYVGYEYLYASPAAKASIRFGIQVEKDGLYEVRLAYRDHENRGSKVPVQIRHAGGTTKLTVNMKESPGETGFLSLGKFQFAADRRGAVVLSSEGADGVTCADAVQILPAD